MTLTNQLAQHKNLTSVSSLKFSILIPAYNAAQYIKTCLESIFFQQFDHSKYEIILVDDCSTDDTLNICSALASNNANLHIFTSSNNVGPGIARNIGVSHACGEWIIFLDSDDSLASDALLKLQTYIDSQSDDLDVIGYNWAFAPLSAKTSDSKPLNTLVSSGRCDQITLELSKEYLLKEYLTLHMDGSVIFTAMRRRLIAKGNLFFAAGYHEDVDYIYYVYWHARRIIYIDDILYFKGWRSDSIVNTISLHHIQGFMRAWRDIGLFTKSHNSADWNALLPLYRNGLVGAIATRAREIYLKAETRHHAAELYASLQACVDEGFSFCAGVADDQAIFPRGTLPMTKYGQIAGKFISINKDLALSALQKAELISRFIGDIMFKSWSCIDLHHSVFLTPEQIRTCCKRFFVDGEMRGDVSLMDVQSHISTPSMLASILQAKKILHTKINSGDKSSCSDCPFLEFRDWGSLEKLEVKYLSVEYHSVCNLKCSYCSEIYFGGKQANYDVKGLLAAMLDSHVLDTCGTVVWGGGEPVVGKDFDTMLECMVDRIPKATQRVLTNSVKHNDTVQRLLAENKINVTTSMDAGTDETYTQVRGKSGLNKALKNLQKYAEANSHNVTVKYIFTECNSSLAEVRAFVSLVNAYNLIECNFQISCDFKCETLALDRVISMIVMYGLLTDAKCRIVFFDDLLRQRMSEIHAESEQLIKQKLNELSLSHILVEKETYHSVAIWGAGWQSRYMIEKSAFFKHVDVAYFIDSRSSEIGKRFMHYDIFGPEHLLDSNIPVVIAAVQNLPLIYKSFMSLGIDESRLIKQLII